MELVLGSAQVISSIPWSELGSGAFGAFAGAYCAFLFERKKAANDQRNAQRASYVKAQAVLFWHINSLREVNRGVVADIKKHGRDKLNEHPFPGNLDRIDLGSVVFLLDSEFGYLVQDLYLAQERYSNVVATIEMRNKLVREIREKAEVVEQNPETGRCILRSDSVQLKLYESLNEQLCDVAERSLSDLDKLQGNMAHAAKSLWPEHRAFRTTERPPENVERSSG